MIGLRRRRRRGQRGFTLIELMIALVVSSLLVGLILAIFLRLSLAYRTQQQVASVQQLLAAGRAAFELDAKHAGAAMTSGFKLADGSLHSPLVIVNDDAGPDKVAFFYGDVTTQTYAAPAPAVMGKTEANVQSTAGFAPGDLVVMSTSVVVENPVEKTEKIVTFQACVLKIVSLTATQFTFSEADPWGTEDNGQCADVADPAVFVPNQTDVPPADPDPAVGVTRFYKLVAHAYRIDPARPGEGVLQVSPSGDLVGLDDWRDLGYGFTDLQVATHFHESTDGVDADGDGNPERDWYSGPAQDVKTAPSGIPFDSVPYEMTISLVARTERDVEGISSTATPALILGGPNNNTLGDRAAVDLTTTGDPTLQGPRIYRFTTFRVDLRNLGVGR